MRVIYTKRKIFKLFGKLNLWTVREDYFERSKDGDDDDDNISIELKERILKQ